MSGALTEPPQNLPPIVVRNRRAVPSASVPQVSLYLFRPIREPRCAADADTSACLPIHRHHGAKGTARTGADPPEERGKAQITFVAALLLSAHFCRLVQFAGPFLRTI